MQNCQSAHEARTSSYEGKRYSSTSPPEDVRQCSLGKAEARHRIRGQLVRRGVSIIRPYTCATFSSGEMRGSIGGSGYALRLKLHASSHLAFFLSFFLQLAYLVQGNPAWKQDYVSWQCGQFTSKRLNVQFSLTIIWCDALSIDFVR